MKNKGRKILQILVFMCCFLFTGMMDVKAEASGPYFSTEDVRIDSIGRANASSIYINANGSGSFSVGSSEEWIYISNDNINFYNDREISFDGEDGNLYFKISMDETGELLRKGFVYVNFQNNDKDYHIKFTKYFETDELLESFYNCVYDVSYNNLPPDKTNILDEMTSGSHTSDSHPDILDENVESQQSSNSGRLPDDYFPHVPDGIYESDADDSSNGIYNSDTSHPENETHISHASEPHLDVNVQNISVSASGTPSIAKVSVDTNQTGGFQAFCDVGWVKIDEFISDGYFHVAFDKNPSYKSRSAAITVSHSTGSLSKTIYVEQSGVQPYLDVNKTSISLQNDGFGGDFEKCVEVTTKDTGDYIVTVDSSCDWIRVSDKSIDDFNDSLSTITLSSGDDFWISVSDNMGGNARTGSISIKHETGSIIKMVSVIQSGRDLATLEASTEYVQFNSSDSDTELLEVYAGNDLEWTALSTDGWINVMDCYASSKKNLISKTGSAKFYISVKENKSSKMREGYVKISANGFEDIEIFVRQPGREKTSGELLKSLIVTVTKKTIYVSQKSKVRFQYPEGMYTTDIKKVQYISNKKNVATVSKGVIKGKKKGKATISVKVTATDGTAKIFKVRVVVDKRLSSATV